MSRPESSHLVRAAITEAIDSGWSLFDFGREVTVEEFAKLCGAVAKVSPLREGGPLVDELRPTARDLAPRSSLSSKYGRGAFPPHTDCAHWATPPRLTVITCSKNEQRRATLLHRWEDSRQAYAGIAGLQRAVYLFGTGRPGFFSTIASPKRSFIRFDPGCMWPATSDAAATFREVLAAIKRSPAMPVHWTEGLCAVIDNWHVLHSRASGSDSGDRVLFRAYLSRPDGCREADDSL